MDKFTEAYIDAMLWSTTLEPYGECPQCGETAVLSMWDDDNRHVCDKCSEKYSDYEPPADQNYFLSDISPELMEKIEEDCASFQADNAELLAEWYQTCGETEERAGHDFWLTREHHGAGFWDRWRSGTLEGLIGKALTDASHAYVEMYLSVGDDGLIYGS